LRLEATEATLMMLRPPRRRKCGRNACVSTNIDVTLMSNAHCQSVMSVLSSVPSCTQPAQLKSTSTSSWPTAAARSPR